MSQKTAWFILHRLRLVVKTPDLGIQVGSSEGGEVEADETFIGGKPKNMHKGRRLAIARIHSELPKWKQTDHYPGKTAVMGILHRDTRQVRAKVVPNVRRATLQGEILKNVIRGSQSTPIRL